MISVIIPIYDRPELSLRSIQSVINQSLSDFELVIVDDGSKSDMSTVRKLVRQSGGLYLRTENRGVAAARNFGAAQANGCWLSFLDSDDEWLKDKLLKQWNFLNQHQELRICQTQELWYRYGARVNPKKVHAQPEGESFFASLKLCCISPSSVMLSRELFTEHGGFDEDLVVCEDYDLWLRITAREKVGLLKEPLIIKRGGHEDQLSRSQPAMDRFRVYSLLKLCCRTPLTAAQLKAALKEAQAKAAVIAAGAKKRKMEERTELYLDISLSLAKALAAKTGEIPLELRDFLPKVLLELKR